MPSYRLINTDGQDLGRFRVAAPRWVAGDRIHHRGAGDLEVVRIVTAEDGDDVDGYLVVSSAG